MNAFRPAGPIQDKGDFQQWGIGLGNFLLEDIFSTDHFPGFERNGANPWRRNPQRDLEKKKRKLCLVPKVFQLQVRPGKGQVSVRGRVSARLILRLIPRHKMPI